MEMDNPLLKTLEIGLQRPETVLLDLNDVNVRKFQKICHFGNFKAESGKAEKLLQKKEGEEEEIGIVDVILLK